MKQSVFVLVGAALLLLAVAGTAQDVEKLEFPKLHEIEIPKVEKITLDNGIRVYLLEDREFPVFEASVRVNCGSYLEPADKIGLASLCGDVMRTGGTQKWTGDEIDELLEGVGASVESYIGTTSGGARVNVLTEYTDLGLEVLAEILRRPVFDQDKIDLAKVQERSSIARRNDNPQSITFREYRKLIYGADSPYARHTEYATINAVTREDLVEFHDKWFHPQNVQIACWGDFDRDELLTKLKKYFGDWQQAGEPVPRPPEVDYTYEMQVHYIEKTDVNQSNVVLGHIGGRVLDEDYADRIVMNNILGGSFGSRLFNSVRSREGLAYAVFGVYTANIAYPGVYYNFASTKSETTGKAVQEIIKEIKRMRTDPPTEDEMRMGKDGYLNSFVFNFDSKAEVVNRLMNYDFYGLPEDFLFEEKENVEQVTPDDVVTAAKEHLNPDALHILVVGKGEDFDMPLEELGYGPVDTIDITIPSGEEKAELLVTSENLERGMSILRQAAEAHGGVENFKKVRTISMKGSATFSMGGQEIPFKLESARAIPDKSRSVVSVMGQTMYTIRNGDTGWKTNQMTGQLGEMTAEDLADEDTEWNREEIHIFSAFDQPYYRAVYDGSGEFGGKQVDFVVLIDQNGEQICRLAVDQSTHELAGKTFQEETPMGAGTIAETISGFTEVEGLKLPATLVQSMNGQKISEVKVEKLVINADLPPETFAKPE